MIDHYITSVDASLLLFEQVQKYLDYTGDYKFVKEELYGKLQNIIRNYIAGIYLDDNNIHLDEDGLISSGTENTQNTWMDAKYDGVAVTPRNGKAVEINALWYNALKIMESLAKKFGDKKQSKEFLQISEKTKKSFIEKFYNKKRKCLYDVLGDSKIRPNQLFSLSLTYPVINPTSEEAKNIINVVEKKLLTPYGLKSLAKGEPGFVDVYDGDGFKRDTSYHQGITWTWLIGLYYDALENMLEAEKNKKEKEIIKEKISKLKENIKKTFTKEINENGCIGGIAEIFDSIRPYKERGTISQAWSVAEIFRIIK